MQDSNSTPVGFDVATVLAMTLNQFLTNALPALVVALLLAYVTGEGWAAIAWAATIWMVYSVGSICSLAILMPRS